MTTPFQWLCHIFRMAHRDETTKCCLRQLRAFTRYIYIYTYYPITTTGISNCPMPRHALNGLKRVTFGKLSLPWSHQLIIFRTPKVVVHTITRTYGMKPLVPHSTQAEIQVAFNQLNKKHTKIQHILSDNVPVFLPCLPVFCLCYCYFVLGCFF